MGIKTRWVVEVSLGCGSGLLKGCCKLSIYCSNIVYRIRADVLAIQQSKSIASLDEASTFTSTFIETEYD